MASQKKRKTGHKQSLARARVLPPEINHLDMQVIANLSATPTELAPQLFTTATVLDHLTHIDRGDADNQRVASKLKCLTLEMEYLITISDGTDCTGAQAFAVTGGPPVPWAFRDRYVDLWIIQNKNPRGVAPTAGSIWELATTTYEEILMRKHDQASEYRVLKHIRELMPCGLYTKYVAPGTSASVTAVLPQFNRRGTCFLQLPADMITTYKDAQSGAISNCIENSLHLFGTLDNAGAGTVNTPTVPIGLRANLRLRFLDM